MYFTTSAAFINTEAFPYSLMALHLGQPDTALIMDTMLPESNYFSPSSMLNNVNTATLLSANHSATSENIGTIHPCLISFFPCRHQIVISIEPAPPVLAATN